MSHAKERKEKNCLNCNAVVAGRFCQVCGQENIETHETFGHLATHFVSDIFHFDGQFFSTLKYLLFRPGFLTYEYVRGRRASYLNPIKMYVFVSAIFFLVFLNIYKPDVKINNPVAGDMPAREIQESFLDTRNDLQDILSKTSISLPNPQKLAIEQKLALVNKNLAALSKDTTHKKELYEEVQSFYISDIGSIQFSGDEYKSVKEYDSIQKALPEEKRDGWLMRRFQERNIGISNDIKENKGESFNLLLESFYHHFPQILFLSLPLFALLLQLLYARRKKWYYANHIIYTVHLYCAIFVFIFLMLLIAQADGFAYLKWLQWLIFGVFLYSVYYSYSALHTFYGQSHGKTLIKWILLNSMALVIIGILFAVMFLFTIITY